MNALPPVLLMLALVVAGTAQSQDRHRDDDREDLQLVCYGGAEKPTTEYHEIRGKFRLNALNQPRLSINRRSGAITIDGLIKFNGRCDADEGHRRF